MYFDFIFYEVLKKLKISVECFKNYLNANEILSVYRNLFTSHKKALDVKLIIFN